MRAKSDVVVTGRGIVSGAGCNLVEFLDHMRKGHSAIHLLDAEHDYTFTRACQVRCHTDDDLPAGMLTLADPVARYALAATRQAIDDAGLSRFEPQRVAVILGSGVGGITALDDSYRRLYQAGNERIHPLTIPRVMLCSAPGLVSMMLGTHGPTYAVSSACASANHAIGDCLRMLRAGVIDIAITGGTEAPFAHGLLRAWEALRVMSGDTCRPFSVNRSGLVLGEGAGILVLERRGDAEARGARVHGSVLGFGASADASHVTKPAVATIRQAIETCLTDARLKPQDIDYINAHGTGTVLNDSTEADAIHKVFGEYGTVVPVSSTKSIHGHTLGASGAMELIATLAGLQQGWLPVTANVDQLDSSLNLNVIHQPTGETDASHALSHSFGFGGLNAVLALGRD